VPFTAVGHHHRSETSNNTIQRLVRSVARR